jgi:hypothetical protein
MDIDTTHRHDAAAFLDSVLQRYAEAVERGTDVPHLDELRRAMFVYGTATKRFSEAEARQWAKARIDELARSAAVARRGDRECP